MENITVGERYLKAKDRIKQLKIFYVHLIVYIIFNSSFLALIYGGYDIKLNFWQPGSFFMPSGWGLGLTIHALIVFIPNSSIFKNWENKKLNQFINEEQQTNNQWE